MSDAVQFWDTSAVVALIFEEPHSPAALRARRDTRLCFAWQWMTVEAEAALRRRRANSGQLKTMAALLKRFQYLELGASDYPSVRRLIAKHRLRAADAGHLFALKQGKKLFADLLFICFDEELAAAARREKIATFA